MQKIGSHSKDTLTNTDASSSSIECAAISKTSTDRRPFGYTVARISTACAFIN